MKRHPRVALAVILIAAAGVGVSCGSSGESGQHASTTSSTASGASGYVGLSKARAIAKAEASGTPWRIGREDDEQFSLTQDFVDDRVTFEIDDGKVTKVTLG